MTSTSSFYAHFPQYEQYHINKAVERKAHLFLFGNVRQHQVIAVGIYTTSPTLSLKQLDTVSLTVLKIDLILHHLIAPIDDAGLYLPQEKSVVRQLLASHIFLHCKIERQSSCNKGFR